MQQPEVYLGKAAELFDADGNLKSESTVKFLKTFIDGFAAWVGLNVTKSYESMLAV